MADKKLEYEVRLGVTGREGITALAGDLDEVAKVLEGELQQQAKAAAQRLRELGAQQDAIVNFHQLKTASTDAARALKLAEQEAGNFERQLGATGAMTAQEVAAQARLQGAVDAARAQVKQQAQALVEARSVLQQFGIASENTREAQARLRAEVAKIGTELGALSPAYRRATQAAETSAAAQVRTHRAVGEGVQSISQQLTQLRNVYGAIASAQGLVHMGKELAETADAANNLQARLRLVTGEGENFKAGWQGVVDIALRTHSALEATGTLFSRLVTAGKDAGLGTQQAIAQSLRLTETINQAVQLSGASAESSNAAITQLIQGLQGGALRGDEFNSVMEQSPRLARALADGLGVTTGELRKMAEAGQLTSETVITALRSQSGTLKQEFEQLPPTVGRALQDLSTRWTLYVSEVDKANGASATAARAIEAVANNLDTLGSMLLAAGKAAAGFGALKVAQYFLGIGVATQTAAAATAANTAAVEANTAAMARNAAATGAATAARSAGAVATTAATAAMTASTAASNAAAVGVGRLGAALSTLKSFTLIGVVTNLKEIGTWLGESVAKWQGYGAMLKKAEDAERSRAEAAKAAAESQQAIADRMKLSAERSAGLSKEATDLIGKFDQMVKAGESAGDAIGKIGKDFDLQSVKGIGDAAAVLDRLVQQGKISAGQFEAAWADALKGQDLAEFEVKANAAFMQLKVDAKNAFEEVQKAIANGVRGEKLDDLQAKADDAMRAVSRGATRSAQVMDASLRESIRRAGLDFDQISGGMGKASRSAINDTEAMVKGLDQLKSQGVDTGLALGASLKNGIDKADGKKAIDAVRAQIEGLRKVLGDKITDGLLDQAAKKAEELKLKFDQIKPGIQGTAEAMKYFGLQSKDALDRTAKESKAAWDAIRNDTTLSAEQLRRAFGKMADDAIAANRGIAPSWLATEEAILRNKQAVESFGRSAADSYGRAGRAAREFQQVAENISLDPRQDRRGQEGGVIGPNQTIKSVTGNTREERLAGQNAVDATAQFRLRDKLNAGTLDAADLGEMKAVVAALKQNAELNASASKLSAGFQSTAGLADAQAWQATRARLEGEIDRLERAQQAARQPAPVADRGPSDQAAAPPPAPAPATTYVSNIKFGRTRERIKFADRDSQKSGEDLIRRILRDKDVSQ